MAAYAWNGVCYQDTASALSAFAVSVPRSDSQGINAFTAAPTISGTGLITWSITNRQLTSGSSNVRAGTTQLIACTPDFGQWQEQGIIFYCALFFAAFIGFAAGYRK